MWDAYCAFYEISMPEVVTRTTWERLIDPANPTFFGVIAERDAQPIGIANCVLHDHTWDIGKRCYLNDLFVDPSVRGQNVGERLIREVATRAAREGWSKVYWLTQKSNIRARRLYDRFAPPSGFIHYTIPPETLSE